MNELEIKKRWLEQEIAIMKMLETIDELEQKLAKLENKNGRRRKLNGLEV